ncbi:MAG: hypothetical protein KME67_10870 [Candidatus Thiodiazotropha sp. (ex Codakia orbicularis)]|nr:hypothetical protein [Candidatus Thiodiazotropha sp. (ex Codakia orbicularis)]
MDQILALGNFMSFNKVHVKTYTTPVNDYIDIQTNFIHLDKDRTIVTPSMTHLLEPNGGAVRWKVEILNKEVVGDATEAKILRIHFGVFIDGTAGIALESIDFFGMIFAGAARNLGDMD